MVISVVRGGVIRDQAGNWHLDFLVIWDLVLVLKLNCAGCSMVFNKLGIVVLDVYKLNMIPNACLSYCAILIYL